MSIPKDLTNTVPPPKLRNQILLDGLCQFFNFFHVIKEEDPWSPRRSCLPLQHNLSLSVLLRHQQHHPKHTFTSSINQNSHGLPSAPRIPAMSRRAPKALEAVSQPITFKVTKPVDKTAPPPKIAAPPTAISTVFSQSQLALALVIQKSRPEGVSTLGMSSCASILWSHAYLLHRILPTAPKIY